MEAALVSVPTKRPRAGRRFQPIDELDLVAQALAAARSVANGRHLVVVDELAGPFGVPDFVAIVGSSVALEQRAALAVPPLLNEIDAGIAAVTPAGRGRTMGELAEALGWSALTIERRIAALLRVGAITRTPSGRFIRPRELQPIGRFYAIETKIRDWRRAVRQGRTYRLWCDNYIVVMPRLSGSSIIDVTKTIASDGAGLVVEGKWLVRPRRAWPAPAVFGVLNTSLRRL